ncbi:hypothetical protein PDE_07479 [Penicillium oxalicum 114-2]|uniref:Nudix hydrolase domain-containing protein n=1 Tax=Penicillium oxalicum (strain 114-2 / CGMCC 5302) TaxID=933388 RepID=S7ZQ36_PENO1|nr:hypothetical protein PDE_07479 [Penicillium oxalicum 114-2]
MAHRYSIAPHLEYLNVPFAQFAASRPEFDAFGVAGFIFVHSAPPTGGHPPPRLLLIQRALTDSMPGCWEGPGGAAEPDEDQTLLDGVVREVAEETGLHVSRIVELSSVDVRYHERRKIRIAKYSFIVEVHEATRCSPDGGLEIVPPEQIPVRLEPTEHSAFDWAAEEDIRSSIETGHGRYKFWPSIAGYPAPDVLRAFLSLRQGERSLVNKVAPMPDK